MPAGASRKRERQYEHIKDSYEDRGVSKAEAEERARANRQQRTPQGWRDQEEVVRVKR